MDICKDTQESGSQESQKCSNFPDSADKCAVEQDLPDIPDAVEASILASQQLLRNLSKYGDPTDENQSWTSLRKFSWRLHRARSNFSKFVKLRNRSKSLVQYDEEKEFLVDIAPPTSGDDKLQALLDIQRRNLSSELRKSVLGDGSSHNSTVISQSRLAQLSAQSQLLARLKYPWTVHHSSSTVLDRHLKPMAQPVSMSMSGKDNDTISFSSTSCVKIDETKLKPRIIIDGKSLNDQEIATFVLKSSQIPKYYRQTPLSPEVAERIEMRRSLDKQLKSQELETQTLQKKYEYISPEDDFQEWLAKIKYYWEDVKYSKQVKKGKVSTNHRFSKRSKRYQEFDDSDYPTEEEEMMEDVVSQKVPEPTFNKDLEERPSLKMAGFVSLSRQIAKLYAIDVFMMAGGQRDESKWLNLEGIFSPMFCYENTPLSGWRKEVVVRMSGATRGTTEVQYVAPIDNRKCRNRGDIIAFFSKYHSRGHSTLSMFDFRGVFCVCHTPEDPTRSYVECGLGIAGCRGWLHPECIGLGSQREDQLHDLETVVCPLCSAYLDGIGETENYSKNMKLLRFVTLTCPPIQTPLHEILGNVGSSTHESGIIMSSSQPPKVWGVLGNASMQYCEQDPFDDSIGWELASPIKNENGISDHNNVDSNNNNSISDSNHHVNDIKNTSITRSRITRSNVSAIAKSDEDMNRNNSIESDNKHALLSTLAPSSSSSKQNDLSSSTSNLISSPKLKRSKSNESNKSTGPINHRLFQFSTGPRPTDETPESDNGSLTELLSDGISFFDNLPNSSNNTNNSNNTKHSKPIHHLLTGTESLKASTPGEEGKGSQSHATASSSRDQYAVTYSDSVPVRARMRYASIPLETISGSVLLPITIEKRKKIVDGNLIVKVRVIGGWMEPLPDSEERTTGLDEDDGGMDDPSKQIMSTAKEVAAKVQVKLDFHGVQSMGLRLKRIFSDATTNELGALLKRRKLNHNQGNRDNSATKSFFNPGSWGLLQKEGGLSNAYFSFGSANRDLRSHLTINDERNTVRCGCCFKWVDNFGVKISVETPKSKKRGRGLSSTIKQMYGEITFEEQTYIIHDHCQGVLQNLNLLQRIQNGNSIRNIKLIEDEVDDDENVTKNTMCDFCTKFGGILLSFELSVASSNSKVRDYEKYATMGFKAHVPCLQYLMNDDILAKERLYCSKHKLDAIINIKNEENKVEESTNNDFRIDCRESFGSKVDDEIVSPNRQSETDLTQIRMDVDNSEIVAVEDVDNNYSTSMSSQAMENRIDINSLENITQKYVSETINDFESVNKESNSDVIDMNNTVEEPPTQVSDVNCDTIEVKMEVDEHNEKSDAIVKDSSHSNELHNDLESSESSLQRDIDHNKHEDGYINDQSHSHDDNGSVHSDDHIVDQTMIDDATLRHDEENMLVNQRESETCHIDVLDMHSEQVSLPVSNETVLEALEPKMSPFWSVFNHHRCCICGSLSGYTICCPALTCSVRAHPLCVALASEQSTSDSSPSGWSVVVARRKQERKDTDDRILDDDDDMSLRGCTSLVCLCPAHRK